MEQKEIVMEEIDNRIPLQSAVVFENQQPFKKRKVSALQYLMGGVKTGSSTQCLVGNKNPILE
jgi:hypothetical protein